VPGEDLSVKSHAHGAFHQHEEVHLSVCLTICLFLNGSALQMPQELDQGLVLG